MPLELAAMASCICVPMIARDEVIGYLVLHSTLPDFFTSHYSNLLQTFAVSAGIALQNARAYRQAQQLAAHEERQRLAHDLHDAVTQSLFSASIISEALLRSSRELPQHIQTHLEEIYVLTRGAMAEMRNLLFELRPEYLLKTSLAEQIQQLVNGLRSRRKFNLIFDSNEAVRLPDEEHIAFYRIAQELLNNVVKHADARNITIRLETLPDRVLLEINDDGRGFVPEATQPGVGLTSIHERASAIHAQLTMTSVPGKGTQVRITWSAG